METKKLTSFQKAVMWVLLLALPAAEYAAWYLNQDLIAKYGVVLEVTGAVVVLFAWWLVSHIIGLCTGIVKITNE